MFAKKSEKALDKLINTPLIKLKRLIIKTQQKQNIPVAIDFIGDDLSVINEDFDALELLLNSILIHAQSLVGKDSIIVFQENSIKLFQKTKLINENISFFNENQKGFLVEIMNKIITQVKYVNSAMANRVYNTYLIPSFIMIKRYINPNDSRIGKSSLVLPNPNLIVSTAFSQRPSITPPPAGIFPLTPPILPKTAYKALGAKKIKFNISKDTGKERDFDQFDSKKLNDLIQRMGKQNPNYITNKGLPNKNTKLFKEFKLDSSNYKKKGK
jgi:hypothetical protein